MSFKIIAEPPKKYLSIYNSQILAFQETSTKNIKAIISFEVDNKFKNLILYPDPKRIYFFYIDEIAKLFFTSYEDDYEYNPNIPTYHTGLKLIKSVKFKVTIYPVNITQNFGKYIFLKSTNSFYVSNPYNYKKLLAPQQKLIYFKGYPFEFSLLLASTVKRYLVNFGNYENIYLLSLFPSKVVDKCGIYVKWFNQQGAYSYYLFDKNSIVNIKTGKSEILSINNLDKVHFFETRKNINKTQTLNVKIPIEDKVLIESLLMSVETYVYTGERYKNTNSWKRIIIENNNFKYKNKQNGIIDFIINFKIPQNGIIY